MFKHDSGNESNLKYAEKLTEEDKDVVEAIIIADIEGRNTNVTNIWTQLKKKQKESNLE